MTKHKLEALIRPKVEKPVVNAPLPTKLPKGFDAATLQDAVVEGKLVAKVGDRLLVSRTRNGKKAAWSVCRVMKVDEATSCVDTYDETVQQCFTFSFNGSSTPSAKLYQSAPEQN
jgi:hypothetical protein